MMLRPVALLLGACYASGLSLGAAIDRRTACQKAVVAAAASCSISTLLLPMPAVAAPDASALADVKAAQAALVLLLERKQAFIDGLANADASAPQLPRAVPFATFQKLEKGTDIDMAAAIDYAEAFRNAKDLARLAKLTKTTVGVTTKGADGKTATVQREYGTVESSGLDSAATYAERAIQEVLGASLALNAAIASIEPPPYVPPPDPTPASP